MRLPSSIKNPRKLKKAWRKAVLRHMATLDMYPNARFVLRWVPIQGWTAWWWSKQERPHGRRFYREAP